MTEMGKKGESWCGRASPSCWWLRLARVAHSPSPRHTNTNTDDACAHVVVCSAPIKNIHSNNNAAAADDDDDEEEEENDTTTDNDNHH